ncbi:MAG TPA: DNA-3-methyladenine glycosylase [Pseudobdellovibrionaceae bacterium]|nr:DNA-3-methyladenine glycosylase [Pseudobdellovibrionaceae bacterium]
MSHASKKSSLRKGKSKRRLKKSFFQRDTETVARELLGKVMCRALRNGRILRGRVVETEAYLGLIDRACHTYGGRNTSRTNVIWGEGGHAYVYLIYGMYDCFNVVTLKKNEPEAVLVRALEPLDGDDYWEQELPHLKRRDWLKGPGRLCRALQITRKLTGVPLDGPEIWFEEGEDLREKEIASSERIGVAYAGEAAKWPLRFFVKGSEFVSGPKALNRV